MYQVHLRKGDGDTYRRVPISAIRHFLFSLCELLRRMVGGKSLSGQTEIKVVSDDFVSLLSTCDLLYIYF